MMKLYAQSSVPPKMPYIHVGYLALKGMVNGAANSTVGMGSMVLGGAILAAALLSGAQRRVADGTLSPGRPALLVGGIFLAIAVFCGGFGIALNAEDQQNMATAETMMRMADQIHERIAFQAVPKIPENTEKLKALLELSDEELSDAWGRPITVRQETYDDLVLTYLLSAGSDGETGTLDDVEYYANR
jgi:hypothetical protein